MARKSKRNPDDELRDDPPGTNPLLERDEANRDAPPATPPGESEPVTSERLEELATSTAAPLAPASARPEPTAPMPTFESAVSFSAEERLGDYPGPDAPYLAMLEAEVATIGAPIVSATIPLPDGPDWTELEPAELNLNGYPVHVEPLQRDADGKLASLRIVAELDAPNLMPGDRRPLLLRHGRPWTPAPRSLNRAAQHALEVPGVSVTLVEADGTGIQRPAVKVKGEEHEAPDVLSDVVRRAGPVFQQDVVERLHDVDGNATGVVAAWSIDLRCDGLAVVELFLVNGYQDLEQRAECGDLELVAAWIDVPAGWRAVLPFPHVHRRLLSSPRGPGTRVDLLAAIAGEAREDQAPNAGAHVFLRQQGTLVRLVLVHKSAAHRLGLSPELTDAERARLVDTHAREVGRFAGEAFPLRGPWSWYQTHRDGPQGGRLAPWTDSFDLWSRVRGRAAVRDRLRAETYAHDAVLSSGNPRDTAGNDYTAIHTGPLGFAFPDGRAQEGEPGGWRIRECGTHALCRELLERRWQELAATVDRHGAFHVGAKGEPRTAYDWAVQTTAEAQRRARLVPEEATAAKALAIADAVVEAAHPTVPFDFRTHGRMTFPWLRYARGSDGAFVLAPNVREERKATVEWRGLCPYERALREQEPVDDEHLVRLTEPAETLARFGSRAALRVLLCAATNAGLHYHPFHGPGQTLPNIRTSGVANGKNRGSDNVGRGLFWSYHAIAAAFTYARDDWRDAHAEHGRAFAETLADLVMTNGCTQSVGTDSRIGQDAVAQGAPAGHRYCLVFQELIGVLAREAVRRAMLRPRHEDDRACIDELARQSHRLVEALIAIATPRNSMPPGYLAVAKADGTPLGSLEDVPRSAAPHRGEHVWYALAFCARNLRELTDVEDARNPFLRAALALGQGYPSLERVMPMQQALEREPWNGWSDTAPHLWGELRSLTQGVS